MKRRKWNGQVLGRHVHVWLPHHPTKLGTYAGPAIGAMNGYRVFSLRWLMVRVWRRY